MRKKKRKNKKRLRQHGHSDAEWRRLYEEYGGKCVCCGKEVDFFAITKDHIVPRSRGGSGHISNIQPMCYECNQKKGRITQDYRPWIPFWAAAEKN